MASGRTVPVSLAGAGAKRRRPTAHGARTATAGSRRPSPETSPEPSGLRSYALASPWWAAAPGDAPRTKVVAREVDTQSRVPLRSGVVVIGGGAGSPPLHGLLCGASVCVPRDGVQEQDGVSYFAIDVRPSDSSPPWRVWRRYTEFREFAVRVVDAGMKESEAPRVPPAKGQPKCFPRCMDDCPGSLLAAADTPAAGVGGAGRGLLGLRTSFALACGSVKFPRRRLHHCTGEALDLRRRELQAWLQSLLDLVCTACAGDESLHGAWGALACEDEDRSGSTAWIPASGRFGEIAAHFPSLRNANVKVVFADDSAEWFGPEDVEVMPDGWRPWMAEIMPFLATARSASRKRTVSKQRPGAIIDDLVLVEVDIHEGCAAGQVLDVVAPDGRTVPVTIPSGVVLGGGLLLWYDYDEGTMGLAN